MLLLAIISGISATFVIVAVPLAVVYLLRRERTETVRQVEELSTRIGFQASSAVSDAVRQQLTHVLESLAHDVGLATRRLENVQRQVGSQVASTEAVQEQLTRVLAALPGEGELTRVLAALPGEGELALGGAGSGLPANRDDDADGYQTAQASGLYLPGHEDLVRELSHSLNSPLAQIEAVASVVIGQQDEDANRRSLQSVLDAVAMCKAFVYAFRRLGDVADAAVGWSPASWRGAIVASSDVYTKRSRTSVHLVTNLPDTLDGYNNSYLTALILPMLENAIEAGVPGSSVDVMLESSGDWNVIRVAGTPRLMPPLERIYERGFSTKQNHEGIGLNVVRRLLSAYGCGIRHETGADRLVFVLTLPRRIG